jgi:hypothetical protein
LQFAHFWQLKNSKINSLNFYIFNILFRFLAKFHQPTKKKKKQRPVRRRLCWGITQSIFPGHQTDIHRYILPFKYTEISPVALPIVKHNAKVMMIETYKDHEVHKRD